MNVETFFKYHGISENPFGAEEARHDAIFRRLSQEETSHPDFGKILGSLDQPSTSVVFGEKGSGKTAIRLMLGHRIGRHNEAADNGNAPTAPAAGSNKTLLVAYDDLNPVLDRYMKHRSRAVKRNPPDAANIEKTLATFRLVDHQDAILSLAVTRLVDEILGDQTTAHSNRDAESAITLPAKIKKVFKHIPRAVRNNFAILAALYDQPSDGNSVERYKRLRRKLALGGGWLVSMGKLLALILPFALVGLLLATVIMDETALPAWIVPTIWLVAAVETLLLLWWAWRAISARWLARKIEHDTPTINRVRGSLATILAGMKRSDLANQPWPITIGGSDARYDLTRRLLDMLDSLGYSSMVVLVDRVDEPTVISGTAERMRSVIWPMFDNKFLQQKGFALKLLLPLELRYLLRKESPQFFQEARLDKQNLVDRLEWSGTTLYDLCTARLRACRTQTADAAPITLADLFEESVTRQTLIDALDQMHQPRDAFKFLYAVVQEHCRMVSADEENYHIPRLTLETVRKQQSQRVQELYQGRAPA